MFMKQQKFDTVSFAKALKTRRVIDLKLGLREVAKKTNTSPATLSRMENENTADIDNILKVCTWLKMPISNFIK